MRTLKIKATLPQAQYHAMSCKHPAFVGGFGTGKSETMANQAMLDAAHGGSACLVGLYEPTYDLVRLIMAPRIEQKLIEHGIRYKYNKSENIVYTSNPQFGDFVLRTLDNPARIIGYETYRAHVDELDTLKMAHAEEAWGKIIARNRQTPVTCADPFNRVSVYTTPEGFRFVHKRWVQNANDSYQMIQASTLTNPFLAADYVQTLRDAYPAALIEAYIDGQFVNLTTGRVYPEFDRVLNNTNEVIKPREILHVGMDFNVNKMSATVNVIRDGKPLQLAEHYKVRDTPSMARLLKATYGEKGHKIFIYPDSSGKNTSSKQAGVSDLSILKAPQYGFSVIAQNANPRIRDRVNAMNGVFCNGSQERRLLVNVSRCPESTSCYEQQAWNDKGEPDKSQDKDHIPDAQGYFISAKYPVKKPVSVIPFNFAIG